jgi:hypothetical protein
MGAAPGAGLSWWARRGYRNPMNEKMKELPEGDGGSFFNDGDELRKIDRG